MFALHQFFYALELLPFADVEQVDGALYAIPIFDHADDAVVPSSMILG